MSSLLRIIDHAILYGSITIIGYSAYRYYDYTKELGVCDYRKIKEKELALINDIVSHSHKSYKDKLSKVLISWDYFDKNYFEGHKCWSNYIKRYKVTLADIHPDYITDQLVVDMIKLGRCSLEDIPKQYYSHELFDKIITAGISLQYVPKEYQTEELCSKSINEREDGYEFYENVKCMQHPYPEVLMKAINIRPNIIKDINPDFQTPSLWTHAIKQQANLILALDKSKQTEELWLIAIKQDPRLIFKCSDPTTKMWFTAYTHDATIIHEIKNIDVKEMLETTSSSQRRCILNQ